MLQWFAAGQNKEIGMPTNDSEQIDDFGSREDRGWQSVIRLTVSVTAMGASQVALVGKIINAKQRKPSARVSRAEVMEEAADCIHPAEIPSNLKSKNIEARLFTRHAHGKRGDGERLHAPDLS